MGYRKAGADRRRGGGAGGEIFHSRDTLILLLLSMMPSMPFQAYFLALRSRSSESHQQDTFYCRHNFRECGDQVWSGPGNPGMLPRPLAFKTLHDCFSIRASMLVATYNNLCVTPVALSMIPWVYSDLFRHLLPTTCLHPIDHIHKLHRASPRRP
jgi:hypothetical protein